MSRRLRIPFVLDVIRADEADAIRGMMDHKLLDRDFGGAGPLLNRMISGWVRRALRVGHKSLPSAALRTDAERMDTQAALTARLDPASSTPWDAESARALAAYVSGQSGRPAAHLCQELVGRLFKPGYTTTEETWRAAETLDQLVRSRNPFKRIFWALAGTAGRVQGTLAEAVGGDLAGVHATGIAVHNLVESLKRMRADWADPNLRATLPLEGAVLRALVAPETVLRQSTADGDCLAGPLHKGTLVTFSVGKAARRHLDPRLSFLRDSWSACPAHHLVLALLAEIWRLAQQKGAQNDDG